MNINEDFVIRVASNFGLSMTPGQAHEFLAHNREKIESKVSTFAEAFVEDLLSKNYTLPLRSKDEQNSHS